MTAGGVSNSPAYQRFYTGSTCPTWDRTEGPTATQPRWMATSRGSHARNEAGHHCSEVYLARSPGPEHEKHCFPCSVGSTAREGSWEDDGGAGPVDGRRCVVKPRDRRGCPLARDGTRDEPILGFPATIRSQDRGRRAQIRKRDCA